MLGIHQKPIAVDEMIVPPVRGDIKLMSIGFFLEENAPIMWRGPMLHKALEQFLSDVHWGELDTLLVDMPPGTGDVAMSLGQLLPRAEALVVTTPQPAAQQVAVRAAQMAQKTGHARHRRRREHVLPRRHGAGALRLRVGVRRSRTRSACHCSPASRSIRCCARPPTTVLQSRSGGRSPRPQSTIAALAESVAATRAGSIRKPLTVLS